MAWDPNEEAASAATTPPESPDPQEPSGKELTIKRASCKHTKELMQRTADEITRLLQAEQQRQNKYKQP